MGCRLLVVGFRLLVVVAAVVAVVVVVVAAVVANHVPWPGGMRGAIE